MLILPVIPHEGIGPLKLGMSPAQIKDVVDHMHEEWDFPRNGEIQFHIPCERGVDVCKTDEGDTYSLRYQSNFFFFLVQYQNERAVEIGIDYQFRRFGIVTLFDTDVFRTPVEPLIAFLKQFSPYSHDFKDEQLSYEYVFHDIGIRLWREDVFHLKLLSDADYMKRMELVIDDMFHYLYFDIVAVRK